MVTHQLQVERRTGKVRRPETDVLPLCHATNCSLTYRQSNKTDRQTHTVITILRFLLAVIMVRNRLRYSDSIGSSMELSPWRILKLTHQGSIGVVPSCCCCRQSHRMRRIDAAYCCRRSGVVCVPVSASVCMYVGHTRDRRAAQKRMNRSR